MPPLRSEDAEARRERPDVRRVGPRVGPRGCSSTIGSPSPSSSYHECTSPSCTYPAICVPFRVDVSLCAHLGRWRRQDSLANVGEGRSVRPVALCLGLDDQTPDAVVLDLMMPQMDGFEVLRRLREDERTRDVPVVVLTAKASQDDRDHCYALGADAFMIKPFDPDELTRELDSLMA